MATFTNQATLSYNGTTVSSNIVTGQMISPLTITKTAVGGSYAAGETVTYVISLVNDGSVTYENLTLTDDLGSYPVGQQNACPLAYRPDTVRYFINGVPQPAPAVTPGAPLVITGISVPAGGNAAVVYETQVTAAAPLSAGGCIHNTAVLTGAGLSTPLEASASVTVEEGAELSILKSLFPATVAENGQLTYTFLIQNHGNTPAEEAAGIVISDLFDPILKDVAVTLNGAPMTAPAGYTYDQASGQFTTVAGQITVPAATYVQTADTGDWTVTPGEATLTVTGTV